MQAKNHNAKATQERLRAKLAQKDRGVVEPKGTQIIRAEMVELAAKEARKATKEMQEILGKDAKIAFYDELGENSEASQVFDQKLIDLIASAAAHKATPTLLQQSKLQEGQSPSSPDVLPKDHINHPKIIKRINRIISKLKPLHESAQENPEELSAQASSNSEQMKVLHGALLDIAIECKASITKPFFDYVMAAQSSDGYNGSLTMDKIHGGLIALTLEEGVSSRSEPYNSPKRSKAFERFELLNPFSETYRSEIENAISEDAYEAIPPLIRKLGQCIDAKSPKSRLKNNYTIAEYNFSFGNHKMILSDKKFGAEAASLKHEAAALFDQSIKLNSDIVREVGGLAFAYLPELRIIESHYNIAKMLMPKVPSLQILAGQMTKVHKDAEFHYKEVIKTCEVVPALSKYIEDIRGSGNVSMADKYTNHLITLLKTKAIAHRSLNQQQEALDSFGAMVKVDPKSQEGFWGMSVSAGILSRHKESIDYAQKALELLEESIVKKELSDEGSKSINATRYMAHLQIGKSLKALERDNKAIERFSQALEFNEDNFEATYELAATYGKIGKAGVAKLMMAALIINHPDDVTILNSLAGLYYSDNTDGAHKEALALYQKVIRLGGLGESDICKADIRIGLILFEQGRVDEALSVFPTTNTIEAKANAAKVWIYKREYQEALIIYKRLGLKDEAAVIEGMIAKEKLVAAKKSEEAAALSKLKVAEEATGVTAKVQKKLSDDTVNTAFLEAEEASETQPESDVPVEVIAPRACQRVLESKKKPKPAKMTKQKKRQQKRRLLASLKHPTYIKEAMKKRWKIKTMLVAKQAMLPPPLRL